MSTKFNDYAGKIINVAEFEVALSEAENARKGLANKKDAIAHSLRARAQKGAPKGALPTLYTRDTAAETAQAAEDVKTWRVVAPGERLSAEERAQIRSGKVTVSAEKTYFEAASLMTTVAGSGCLSKAFKQAIEACADHRDLLARNALTSAESKTDSGYQITIDINAGTVDMKTYVVPEGNCRDTKVCAGKSVRTYKVG